MCLNFANAFFIPATSICMHFCWEMQFLSLHAGEGEKCTIQAHPKKGLVLSQANMWWRAVFARNIRKCFKLLQCLPYFYACDSQRRRLTLCIYPHRFRPFLSHNISITEIFYNICTKLWLGTTWLDFGDHGSKVKITAASYGLHKKPS